MIHEFAEGSIPVSRVERRRELGEGTEPIETELEISFNRIVDEGAQRLHRTYGVMLVTGLSGGFEIGVGVMAYLAVLHETGSHLLAGLPFGIGLIGLLLAKSELFTENFLVPITAAASREASLVQLAKLWGITLVANLVSGWIVMWVIARAFPEWTATIVSSGEHFVTAAFDLRSICLAVLAGGTITLLTRMQHGTQSPVAQILAAVAVGFLLGGLQLWHSILDSLLIFGAIQVGADISYGQWLSWFGFTLLFNILGGLLLVTVPRLLRTKELIQRRRRASPPHPDSPRTGS